jgi:CheY-like chemotaxis protein
MPDGGTLTFRTDSDGQRVFCHVADTGVGMPEEVRRRVFDPFFTTKGTKAPDFGLSGAYAMVNRHGGEMTVESAVAKGTTITLWLPALPESAELAPESPLVASAAPVSEPLPAAQTLVVADGEEVRELFHDLLSRQGHTVVACADADSALAELQTRKFDLVMVNLALPGTSGLALANRLKERSPESTVAVMTSFFDRVRPDDPQVKGVDFVVKKPFSLDQIQAIVDHAASRPHPHPPAQEGI